MNVAVLVPFNEGHMKRIREAAGEGATVTQLAPDASDEDIREALSSAEVVIGEPDPVLLRELFAASQPLEPVMPAQPEKAARPFSKLANALRGRSPIPAAPPAPSRAMRKQGAIASEKFLSGRVAGGWMEIELPEGITPDDSPESEALGLIGDAPDEPETTPAPAQPERSFPWPPEQPALKWIQMTWAGADKYTTSHIPFPKGVALTNVAGGAYGHIISQYVVGQILSITQNLAGYIHQQPTQSWRDLGRVMSLEGATVLIFGAGDLGGSVAKRLSSFDVAKIVGVCRDKSQPREHFDELITLNEADGYLGKADIVVCCMPNTPQTERYFSDYRLHRLKQGSVLVNAGRGNFIDNDALYRVLVEGRLRGVALDVTDPEPLPMMHPLWRHPACNITPHVAGRAFGSCDETEERIAQMCCDNLRRYVAGEELEHRVF